MSRSVSHGQIYEYIDERLRVACCYFALSPSQRADLNQQTSTRDVHSEPADPASHQQTDVSEHLSATDYEFTEHALADVKVRYCSELKGHCCLF